MWIYSMEAVLSQWLLRIWLGVQWIKKQKRTTRLKNCIKVEITQAKFKCNGITLLLKQLHTPHSYWSISLLNTFAYTCNFWEFSADLWPLSVARKCNRSINSWEYSTVSPNLQILAWIIIHLHKVMWQNVKLFNYAAYAARWFLSLQIESTH